MRVLLDESLPRPLGRLLVGHTVRTVSQAGWTSFQNGVLLKLAEADFDVVFTRTRTSSSSRTSTHFRLP